MIRFATLGFVMLALTLPAQAAGVDKLLPDDSEVVISVNVRQILDSPLMKKVGLQNVKEALGNEPQVSGIMNDLGFDPFKDLDTVLMASPGGMTTDKGLIIIQGKFDLAKIQAKAEQTAKDMADKLKIEKAGGYTLYKVTTPDASFYAALADKNTALAGESKEYVIDGLDKFAGKKTTALKSKPLQELLAKVDQKQSIWLAVPGSALPKELPFDNEKMKKSIESIEAISGGITIGDDIKIKLQVGARDADSAKGLARDINNGLNTAKGLILLAGSQFAPLADVLGTVRATAKEKVINLDCQITAEVIEKIKQGGQ